jgi:hypothetical protein
MQPQQVKALVAALQFQYVHRRADVPHHHIRQPAALLDQGPQLLQCARTVGASGTGGCLADQNHIHILVGVGGGAQQGGGSHDRVAAQHAHTAERSALVAAKHTHNVQEQSNHLCVHYRSKDP